MSHLSRTIEKIENCSSISELKKIKFTVNYPPIGWSDTDKIILNSRIEDAVCIIEKTQTN